MSDASPVQSRVMVFGGTFDPPHRAHVELPLQAARQLGVSRLIYVPAAVSPHKSEAPPESAAHRCAMLGLALADHLNDTNPTVEISSIEVHRGGPSYFVDTIRSMRQAIPDHTELLFLIGTDQVVSFHRWKDWEAILECAEPAVLPRRPWIGEELEGSLKQSQGDEQAAWWMARVLDVPTMETSSTDIRAAIDRGDIHPAVRDYIEQHGLYERQSNS